MLRIHLFLSDPTPWSDVPPPESPVFIDTDMPDTEMPDTDAGQGTMTATACSLAKTGNQVERCSGWTADKTTPEREWGRTCLSGVLNSIYHLKGTADRM